MTFTAIVWSKAQFMTRGGVRRLFTDACVVQCVCKAVKIVALRKILTIISMQSSHGFRKTTHFCVVFCCPETP